MTGKNKLSKKFLLHACCSPCLTHPYQLMKDDFQLTVFFYNPNIHPESEYILRKEEMQKLAKKWGFKLVVGEYDVDAWFEAVQGHESDKEGGERCEICYRFRLEKTAELAAKNGYDLFTTTLSISPLKKAQKINEIGKKIAQAMELQFYEADFKKKDGFKISSQLSREQGLYRQDYCGCQFSRRGRDNIRGSG